MTNRQILGSVFSDCVVFSGIAEVPRVQTMSTMYAICTKTVHRKTQFTITSNSVYSTTKDNRY